MDTVWDIPYSFSPDSFAEPGVNEHIWNSHLLRGKFPNLYECPRGVLLETHSMDVLVNGDGVFSGSYLIVGRTALVLLTTLLSEPFAGPGLERKSIRYSKSRSFYSNALPFTVLSSLRFQ